MGRGSRERIAQAREQEKTKFEIQQQAARYRTTQEIENYMESILDAEAPEKFYGELARAATNRTQMMSEALEPPPKADTVAVFSPGT